jgi:ATP-dependent DNA ligase
MMAKLTDKLPEGEQWTYEVKWDGYRALLLKSGDRVRLLSRKDNDLTATYPTIEAAGRKLQAETATLDGEIVAIDPKGRPSFQGLQHRSAHRNYAIVFSVDALVVGYYEGKQLRFAGKVRAGFTPHLRRDVLEALKPLQTAKCPFVDLPNSKASHWGGGVTAEQMAEMTWVKPKVVAQIRFVEFTNDGHLRHAALLGLRSDKRASEVRREA